METLFNGFTIDFPQGAFPLSTDSMALSGFIRLGKNAKVLDLGSGCGTLGILLCARKPDCSVVGIELDQAAHLAALQNAKDNQISLRLSSIWEDLKNIPKLFPSGSFSCCVSNPPYFSGGPESKTTPLARREDACSMEELFSAAAWALRYGGDFYLVHRPERLGELFAQAAQHNLAPKRLCLLRHFTNGPVTLVLVQCRKGGKHGLIWEEESFFHPDGSPTNYYRKLYHL